MVEEAVGGGAPRMVVGAALGGRYAWQVTMVEIELTIIIIRSLAASIARLLRVSVGATRRGQCRRDLLDALLLLLQCSCDY